MCQMQRDRSGRYERALEQDLMREDATFGVRWGTQVSIERDIPDPRNVSQTGDK